jgi:putative phosphotransacetylase
MTQLNIPMPREQLERVVRQVVRQRFAERLEAGEPQLSAAYAPNLVVNISARHLHISREHLEKLFGPGAELTVYRWLYQPGEFAAEQRVTVIGPRRRAIENVRILGPVRDSTQVEVSFTDAVALGIDAPVCPSGKTEGSPGCILLGPAGVLELPEGVIRAERHVHMTPADAEYYGFEDGQYVKLHVDSDCATTLENIKCRVKPQFLLEVHLDTDEGNACDLPNARAVWLST